MLVEKYGWTIQKSLFAQINQDSKFSHTRENSKMFNLTFLTINHLKAEPRQFHGVFKICFGETLSYTGDSELTYIACQLTGLYMGQRVLS